MKFPARLAVPLLALLLVAAAKKEPGATVRFYNETNPQDTSTFSMPVTLISAPKQIYINKIAPISERDVAAIYPFDAADGTSGCAFKLDEHGQLALDTLSIEKRGTWLVAAVNGRHVIDIAVNQRVADGIISIPRGLTAGDIDLLRKKFRILG